MSMDKHTIEDQVRRTMEVAGRISAVPASPFLWTRIEAEINQTPSYSFLYQIRWQLVAVTGIILLNGAFLGMDLNKASKTAELSAVQNIWQDYDQSWSTEVYLPETVEPS